MGLYNVTGFKGAAVVQGILNVRADATRPRRGSIMDMSFANNETPDDLNHTYVILRSTTAPTGNSVTPAPNDEADAATELDAADQITVDPTLGAEVYRLPLNQRASWRFVPTPGREWIWAATANHGLTLAHSAAVPSQAAGALMVNEH